MSLSRGSDPPEGVRTPPCGTASGECARRRTAGFQERSEGVRRIYSVRREGLVELREWLDSIRGDALEAFKEEAEKPRTKKPRKSLYAKRCA